MAPETFCRSPFARGLSPEEAQRVFALGTLTSPAEGERVITEGEPQDQVYVVLDGRLSVCLPGTEDRYTSVGLAHLEPGECCGEYAFVDGKPASASVVANEGTRLLAVRNEDLAQLLATDAPLGRTIYRNLLGLLVARLREDNAMLDMFRPA